MSDQRLIAVEIVVSGVIPAPLDAVWERVSNFTEMGDWLAPMHGERVRTSHMAGAPPDGQIGCLRAVTIRGASYCERLEGLDSCDHVMRWKLISHPQATNPFGGAFINNTAHIKLRTVTMDNSSYMKWQLNFETDIEGRDDICHEIEAWMIAGFQGLELLFSLDKPSLPARSQEPQSYPRQSAPMQPGSPVYSTPGIQSSVPGRAQPQPQQQQQQQQHPLHHQMQQQMQQQLQQLQQQAQHQHQHQHQYTDRWTRSGNRGVPSQPHANGTHWRSSESNTSA